MNPPSFSSISPGTVYSSHHPHRAVPITMPGLEIRVAQLSDLWPLTDILTSSFYTQERFSTTSSFYTCLIALMAEPTTAHGSMRNLDQNLIGTVEISIKTHYLSLTKADKLPYVSNLAVHQAWRGQGIAQQLLSASEQVVLSWGFHELCLHVLEKNYPARNLYQKVGYRLYQTDLSWDRWLPWRSSRLLLHKRLVP
jgi:GNAT superfamily N-acetyltransferase